MRIAILLAACAGVLLTGCGSDDASTSEASPKPVAEATQPTTSAAAKEVPDARDILNGAIDAMRA
jgi:hypothetical protein